LNFTSFLCLCPAETILKCHCKKKLNWKRRQNRQDVDSISNKWRKLNLISLFTKKSIHLRNWCLSSI
jgi:hypothetical protein